MALVTIVLQDAEDSVDLKVFVEPDIDIEALTPAQEYALVVLQPVIGAHEEAGEPEPFIPDPED